MAYEIPISKFNNNTELLQIITNYYKLLQIITKYYKLLQIITNYYKLLQQSVPNIGN